MLLFYIYYNITVAIIALIFLSFCYLIIVQIVIHTRVTNIHHLKSNTKMYNSMKATALHTRILVIYRNQWPLLKYENKNLGCIVIDLLKLILIYP